MKKINDHDTYIDIQDANNYMLFNVSVTGWGDLDDDEKTKYIITAYQEMEKPQSSDSNGETVQLNLLRTIYTNPRDFYASKNHQIQGIKSFTDSKLKVEYSESAVNAESENGATGGNANHLVDL